MSGQAHFQASCIADGYELCVVPQNREGVLECLHAADRSQLAWAQAEVRRYADALQTTQQVPGASPMARAVVLWLSQEREEGLRDFEGTLRSQPEWGNPAWVKALYSATVAQSVREMQAERELRELKARALSRH